MTSKAAGLGAARVDPSGAVVAGSFGTWRVTYTAGERGVEDGGRIRVFTECDTDWGLPQLHDPAAADYLTVESPPEAPVSVRIDSVKGLTLFVHGRGLVAGDEVTVTYGDRSGGGAGSRAQCFSEGRRYFHVAEALGAGAPFTTLPDSPHVAVTGGDAARLMVIAPSTTTVGQGVRVLVRVEDSWGNPAAAYRGSVRLTASGVDMATLEHTFTVADGGLWWVEGWAGRPGAHTLTVGDGRLAGVSNPMVVTAEKPAHTLYWGDPHGGQVADARKIPDFFRYARDAAGISFVGYQRNDHAHSSADYTAQQAAEQAFDEPGRFVPLPGFEWSAEPSEGGHHNVYFRRHGQPMRRNSHWDVEDRSDEDKDLPHITDVYAAYRGTDTLITPHVGGEHANLTYHEPALEPALEVTSTHGSFEWFLRESLEHGYQMGFVGGSDSHDGRPGADSPGHQERRYARGGLTGLFVGGDLRLDSVHEALGARRCYATTGARIVTSVRLGDHQMGASVRTSAPPVLSVAVHGTAPLESVEVYRGVDLIYSHPLEQTTVPHAVRLLWQGASRKMSYSGVQWDGSLRLTGGSISEVEQIRFDSPRSHIWDVKEGSLRWRSVQCGYRSGLVVHVVGVGDTANVRLDVAVSTTMLSRPLFGGHGDDEPPRMAYAPGERVALTCRVSELERGARTVPLGVLDRSLTLSLAPSPRRTRSAEFDFRDDAPRPGVNAYWVRVIQTDMEMAWTSPLFVDYVSPSP